MNIRRKNTIAWIKRFSDHGRWYADIVDYIRKTYADPILFANLLAATSPRKTVKANWILANRIYREHKAGKPYSRQGLMPCHTGNIDRAISGQPLSGNKVRSFAENLCGNFESVTIDVWILRYFGYDENKAISDKSYAKISDKIRRIAKKTGYSPAAIQAILWTISRFNYGLGGSSFLGHTKQAQFSFMGE
jgi:hypothetical protein